MGMSTGQSGVSGGRRRRSKRYAPVSEINVTPFVDVMLVLLIIFMVAAPILLSGVPIDLPTSKAKPLDAQTQPIIISQKESGEMYIGETPINPGELVSKLRAITKNNLNERILFKGERSVTYEQLMQVLGAINQAKFAKIGLVTLPEQGGSTVELNN